MNYVCRYLFLRFKGGRKNHQINPSQTLMNLQYCSCLNYKYYSSHYCFIHRGKIDIFYHYASHWRQKHSWHLMLSLSETFRSVRVSLQSQSLHDTVRTILKACSLSLDHLESFPESLGNSGATTDRPIKWDPSFYRFYGIQNPDGVGQGYGLGQISLRWDLLDLQYFMKIKTDLS